jgi:hypothetical protein
MPRYSPLIGTKLDLSTIRNEVNDFSIYLIWVKLPESDEPVEYSTD